MKRLKPAALAMLAVLSVVPAQAATPASKACQSAAEINAERVRQIQTEFMVAALKCRKDAQAGVLDRYNAFVRKFSPELVKQSNVLQAYFKRGYGAGYLKRYDSYITRLANEMSMRGQHTANYCAVMRPHLDAALQLQPKALGDYQLNMQPVNTLAKAPTCTAPDIRVATNQPTTNAATAPAPAAASKAAKPAAKPASKATAATP
jgi:hypothetical protein